MSDSLGNDGRTGRRAMRYAATIIALAALACALATVWAAQRDVCAAAQSRFCDTPAKTAVLAVPGAILLLGGLVAFVQTYRVWRRGGAWVIWQGAGWFLFVFMTVYLGIGATMTAG
ncbi:hypothetical protein ACFXK0_25815 [Nocardia sp. NPDC059177]|uniref:hypothetical protein n=1 Tax=Nocardia sp. NPDC059177 TaxID=3346759 RepID=UPI003680EF1A